jgi:hypothetical protein
VERLDTVTLEKMLLDKENQKNSFGGRVRTILEPWLSETTSIRARGGLHSHFFGSDSSDVAMQSSWSFGPTVGLIWQKKKEEWGLGLESNAYMSVSGRAFFFGLHGDAFGEYELPRGFISAGLRYDFSVGRVVGVQLREQMGTVTEEELNALAIPGVALSLGVWTGYRYPIYENIDAQVRVGFRNDGKRMYFDSDIGAVFSVPF